MVRYERTIRVPRPAEEVFAYLSGFHSVAEWDPSVRRAAQVSPGAPGLGSAFDVETVFLGNTVLLRYTIAEFDPPRRVVLVAENRSVRSKDSITIEPVERSGGSGGQASDLRYVAELDLRGWARYVEPLFSLAFRRIGDRAAEGLARALGAGRVR